MSEITPERRAKLPAWARSHVERLERKVAELEQQIAERDDEVGPTSVYVRGFTRADRPLPPNASIRFVFDPEDPEARVDVALDVNRYSRVPALTIDGGRALVIRPHVTNVVTVRPETREERRCD